MLADLYGSVFSHNLKPGGESSYCISELIFCQHRRQIIFMLIDVNKSHACFGTYTLANEIMWISVWK